MVKSEEFHKTFKCSTENPKLCPFSKKLIVYSYSNWRIKTTESWDSESISSISLPKNEVMVIPVAKHQKLTSEVQSISLQITL